MNVAAGPRTAENHPAGKVRVSAMCPPAAPGTATDQAR